MSYGMYATIVILSLSVWAVICLVIWLVKTAIFSTEVQLKEARWKWYDKVVIKEQHPHEYEEYMNQLIKDKHEAEQITLECQAREDIKQLIAKRFEARQERWKDIRSRR
jgi:hypothetical protein